MSEEKKGNKIGNKIKDHMQSFGITVKELSHRTGIEIPTLYSILNGHHQPSIDKLGIICKELRISIDALLDIEVNTLPIYAEKYKESLSYAHFEDVWFGESGGERISVSRNFSIANHSEELRRAFLKNIYQFPDEKIETAIEAFNKRQEVIKNKEKRRIEIVVESEISDFITRKKPFDLIDKKLIEQCIGGVIDRLENKPLDYEVIIIPRQFFLVNYEIINRQVILFDLGSVFFRQTHANILNHFLKEVENFKYKLAVYSDRHQVIQFLKDQMNGK